MNEMTRRIVHISVDGPLYTVIVLYLGILWVFKSTDPIDSPSISRRTVDRVSYCLPKTDFRSYTSSNFLFIY